MDPSHPPCKQTSAKVDQMITSSEALAEVVRKRGNVRINTDRILTTGSHEPLTRAYPPWRSA